MSFMDLFHLLYLLLAFGMISPEQIILLLSYLKKHSFKVDAYTNLEVLTFYIKISIYQ